MYVLCLNLALVSAYVTIVACAYFGHISEFLVKLIIYCLSLNLCNIEYILLGLLTYLAKMG